MVLNSVSAIATHIATKWPLPNGISGALVDTVSLQRIKVQNYAGISIDASNIAEAYQDIITDFAKADVLEEAFAWSSLVATGSGAGIAGGGTSSNSKLKLGEFEVDKGRNAQTDSLGFLSTLSQNTPAMLRKTAQASLDAIGGEFSSYKVYGTA